MGINEVKKPNRFGTGKCVTVAVVNLNNYLGTDIITLDNVIAQIKKYQTLLDNCIE